MATSAPPEVILPVAPSSAETLVRLFPGIRSPPSVLAPCRIPGHGPETMAALLKALRDNHERSHVFFNQFSFHKYVFVLHGTFRILTCLSLRSQAILPTTCLRSMPSAPLVR